MMIIIMMLIIIWQDTHDSVTICVVNTCCFIFCGTSVFFSYFKNCIWCVSSGVSWVLVTHPASSRKRTGRSGMVARKPRRRWQERGVNARDCLSFIPSHNVISVVRQDADISSFESMYNDSTLYCWSSFWKDDWLKITPVFVLWICTH